MRVLARGPDAACAPCSAVVLCAVAGCGYCLGLVERCKSQGQDAK